MAQTIDDIFADFDFLDDWEDRYRYVIDLGRDLKPYPEVSARCRCTRSEDASARFG